MKKPTIYWLIPAVMLLLPVWCPAQEKDALAPNEKTPSVRIGEAALATPRAEKLISASTPPPVQTITPGMLNSKEGQALEKSSLFWYRNKQILLKPSSAGFGAIENERIRQEEIQFRYYFDTAMQLYKNGRFEEAREILEYLSERMPDDEYLAYYLNKLRKEGKPEKESWLNNTKQAIRLLRDNEIKRLTEEGTGYFEQGEFDNALLKFSDILAVDPENKTAQAYMSKLKGYYSKEVRAERITEEAQSQVNPPRPKDEEPKPVDALLDMEEEKTSFDVGDNPAQKILDDAEFEILISEKRASSLMDKTELDSRVRAIMAQKQYEEKKSGQLTFGPGDIIRIVLNGHPELTGEAMVATNGYIFLPVTNEPVYAKDSTLEELTAQITEIEKKYVRNPVVNIEILDYRSKLFYVIDETSCTPYPITKGNLTLLDALFLSDWGDDRALARVLVIKPSQLHPIIKKVNAYDLIFRGKLASNIRIDNGDIIYVPSTIAAKTANVINKAMAPFSSLNSAVNTMRTLRGQGGQVWANSYSSNSTNP